MMSLFSKLFGGGSPKEPEAPIREEPVTYDGYSISAAPEKADGGQWRLAGYITKKSDEGDMERQFIRADLYSSREDAIEYAIKKGQQVLDQQGDRIFADGKPTGRA